MQPGSRDDHRDDPASIEPSGGPSIGPSIGAVAVIFTSRRTDLDDDGYAAMADRMDELARRQPGYLGIESARGADRLGITVSYWAGDEDARSWKQVADHLGAQRLGRERWYEEYSVVVATVTRTYDWTRG